MLVMMIAASVCVLTNVCNANTVSKRNDLLSTEFKPSIVPPLPALISQDIIFYTIHIQRDEGRSRNGVTSAITYIIWAKGGFVYFCRPNN